ncbi:MAG: LysR family transcriptional regulator [Planctomycetes bacterium]|nr:LysR family transcriptional regulator [Planctomycetota bacterium]MBI3844079.1 LysR family transcriptional regulator [Planctomycetota bacterium]
MAKASGNGASRSSAGGRRPEPWRYQLDLQQLEILTKIIETGSFSKAAAAVYLTQPTVSTHVATLEKTFGLRLLDRMGRRTKPTAAGQVVYSYAKKMLALRAQAVEEVDLLLGLVRGDLTIAGSTIPGTYVLPAAIGKFVEKHADVRITLQLADSDAVIDLVASGEAELGVTGSKPRHPEIAAEPFGEDEIVLVAPPGHALAGERRITGKRLRDVSLIAREPGSGTQRTAEDALRRVGVSVESLKIICRLGSSEAVREGVCAGIGVAFLSRRAVADDLESGRLREIEVDGIRLRRPFHLVRPRRRALSPLGRAFHEHLKARGPA